MKHAYSVAEVSGLLGLSGEKTRELIETVFEGPRDVLSFQDLALLRAAREIGTSGRKLTAALERVREQLPSDQPLSAVTLQKIGKELVVNAGHAKWNAKSGQGLLAFDRAPAGRGASWLRPVPTRDADALFANAVRLEEVDGVGAIAAYAEAVAADPHHADAHVNLGRLLHQHGRLREAEAHYVAALVSRPTDATACFNLAVVLEDLGRIDDAIARYRETLELDPHVVDAYFNLSRLYEKKGEKIAAIRSLKDYRRFSGNGLSGPR
jgi:tetratricopeptide (TPR) repeat protein